MTRSTAPIQRKPHSSLIPKPLYLKDSRRKAQYLIILLAQPFRFFPAEHKQTEVPPEMRRFPGRFFVDDGGKRGGVDIDLCRGVRYPII